MGDVVTFLFFFLTYVASAMWFHWRGFNLGIDSTRKVYENGGKLP